MENSGLFECRGVSKSQGTKSIGDNGIPAPKPTWFLCIYETRSRLAKTISEGGQNEITKNLKHINTKQFRPSSGKARPEVEIKSPQ